MAQKTPINVNADVSEAATVLADKGNEYTLVIIVAIIALAASIVLVIKYYFDFKKVDNDSRRMWENESQKISEKIRKQRERNAKRKNRGRK